MLPERRKNLIIGIVSLIVLIILVIVLYNISNYIKGTNEDESIRTSKSYSSIYDYLGIILNEDGVYEIYGINSDEEVSLNLTTFYEVQDAYVKDKKLIIYSDAVNEIRYDGDEFYFYEIDGYYNNNYNVLLAEDYLVIYDDTTVAYKEYGDSTEFITITSNLTNTTVFVEDNTVYYLANNYLYEYDLTTQTNNLLTVSVTGVYAVFNGYVYYALNDSFYVYDTSNSTKIDLTTELIDTTIIGFYEDGILYTTFNTFTYLNKYNINDGIEDYSYNLLSDSVSNVYAISDGIYYIETLKDGETSYKIVKLSNKSTLKTLTNNYLFVGEI